MFFGRKSRRSSRYENWQLSPFSPSFRIGGIHFEGDNANEGGETGLGGTTTINPPAVPAVVAAPAGGNDSRLGEALRERKKARGAFRALISLLGFDPEKVKIVNTGDPSNPYRIEGAPDIESRLAIARAAGGATNGNGPRGKGIPTVEVATLNAQVASLRNQVNALVVYIKRTAVVEPIRAACVRHHAIDDDAGAFDDVVTQIAPRFKVDVDFDSEDANSVPEVRVYAVDGNGAPLIDSTTTQPATPDSLVAEFLGKRPKYRQANFRGGPGAGGSRVGIDKRSPGLQTAAPVNGNGNGNGNPDPELKTAQAMATFLGGGFKAEDILNSQR